MDEDPETVARRERRLRWGLLIAVLVLVGVSLALRGIGADGGEFGCSTFGMSC